MNALVILMLEAEQPEGLSSRKLVVETAKHNVLTAYSVENGLNLLHRFPNVDAVLVHESLIKQDPALFDEIRKCCGKVPIILASPFAEMHIPEADYFVDSFQPQELLKLLDEKFSGEERS